MSLPKIDYISLNMFHVLAKNNAKRGMGGAELQGVMIGKELIRRGYDFKVITLDHTPDEIDGEPPFPLIPTFRREKELPGIGFFYPRMYKIWQALKNSDADIFFVNDPGFALGPVVHAARKFGKKVLLWGASDSNFDPSKFRIPNARDKWLYVWGLKRCDYYVVQNRMQQESLKKHYGKGSQIIYNGLPQVSINGTVRDEVLWVGSIRKVKQPHLMVELASRIPNQKFVMIGGSAPHPRSNLRPYFEDISAKAEKLDNLEFNGFLPYEEVERRFQKAKLLVSTSSVEGFPNTFLQAWSRGVPVISFVNPDNLLDQGKLGKSVSDLDEMTETVKSFLKNEATFSTTEIKRFFDENLTIDQLADKMEKIFQTMLNQDGAGRHA